MEIFSGSVARVQFQKVLQEVQEKGKTLQKVSKALMILQKAEILFSTANASIAQCDATGRYLLSFHDKLINFRACEFISFRRKVQKIDLVHLLRSETADVEIISMPHCDQIFVFSIEEILELKELFAGAFAMLELNSVIHKEIIRKGLLV